MHVKERWETYQVKKKTWETLKNTWNWGLEWEKVFREERRQSYRERDWEKWRPDHTEPIYKGSIKLTDRGVERCRDMCRENRTSTDAAVERCWERIHQTQLKKLDRSTNCREGIEDPGTFSIDPLVVETAIEIAIRNSLRSWQVGQVSRGVEEVSRLLKNIFSRREKHRYECNQACNSTNDPNSILSSQNHLLTTILST